MERWGLEHKGCLIWECSADVNEHKGVTCFCGTLRTPSLGHGFKVTKCGTILEHRQTQKRAKLEKHAINIFVANSGDGIRSSAQASEAATARAATAIPTSGLEASGWMWSFTQRSTRASASDLLRPLPLITPCVSLR